MKDRKTRTSEIREEWIEETKGVRKSFWERETLGGFWPDEPYGPPKYSVHGLTREWYQAAQEYLEKIYEEHKYNEIYKEHVMAYRIINRWKSARVNLHTPLGQKVASKLADEYEQCV
tara:strand:- start:158 stop:508 length:351 start_codon:yes stop_codon:yes gene_type:complete